MLTEATTVGSINTATTELVTEPLVAIRPDGIQLGGKDNGRTIQVDALIWATGFSALGRHYPVYGDHGQVRPFFFLKALCFHGRPFVMDGAWCPNAHFWVFSFFFFSVGVE